MDQEDDSDQSRVRDRRQSEEEDIRHQVRIAMLASPESSPSAEPSHKRRSVGSPVSRSSSDSSLLAPKRSANVRFRSFEHGALSMGRQSPQRTSRLSVLSTALSLDLFYLDER